MKTQRFLVTAAVAAVASVAAAGTATAAPKAAPSAHTVGNVKLNKDGTGEVKAHYLCPSGPDWHLWVSVKQTANGSRDDGITQEGAGFGHVAARWLQNHPVTFKCDGKWHTQKFQVDTREAGYGRLIKGDAWVQFCLIDEPDGIFLIDQHWDKVR
jgi:hypothetical protein